MIKERIKWYRKSFKMHNKGGEKVWDRPHNTKFMNTLNIVMIVLKQVHNPSDLQQVATYHTFNPSEFQNTMASLHSVKYHTTRSLL